MQSINKHYILVGGEGEKGHEIPKGHIGSLFPVTAVWFFVCLFFKQGIYACLNTLFCEIFSFKKKKKFYQNTWPISQTICLLFSQ